MFSVSKFAISMTGVSISLVTYNSATVIERCLAGIPYDIPILVFDNRSTDHTLECLKSHKNHQLQIISSKKNIGFGRGHNENIALVKTKYLLILNPDCFINQQNIELLINSAEQHPNAAIVGPTLYQTHEPPQPFAQQEQLVHFVSGACMLLRMSVFNQIGFFDPQMFLYFEDDELCWRAQQFGYDLLITSKAKAHHLQRASSPPSYRLLCLRGYYYGKSEIYFSLKKRGKNKLKRMIKYQLLYLKKFIKTLGHKPTCSLLLWLIFNSIGNLAFVIKPKNSGLAAKILNQ